MLFQVEFVKFDPYCSTPRAVICLATQFDSLKEAKIEARREIFAAGAEGYRIIQNAALIVEQARFAPPPH